MHNDNKTMLARFIRDACTGELILPRLEALTPVQILAEIGAEKIRRFVFLGNVSLDLKYEEHVQHFIFLLIHLHI